MDLSLKNVSANLAIYGTTHAIVDAICAAIIFTILRNNIVDAPTFLNLIIIYNLLAFGLQSSFGLLIDYLKMPKLASIVGCMLVGISAFIFLSFPILSIVFAGLGNAIFHVGGGTISLNLRPTKASAPGIFVAPGALGLFVGTLLGEFGYFVPWQAVGLLLIFCLLIIFIKSPNINYTKNKQTPTKHFELILLLILLSIAIRSLVGFAVIFPWKINLTLLALLTVAVVLGKALGGVLADKFGWTNVAVGALVLSIPFLAFAPHIPILAIIGMFLFNITMPVTLVAISNSLPARPGFAFGLTCLALLFGVLPIYLGLKPIISTTNGIFFTILVSSIVLYYGLKLNQTNK